MLNIIKNRHSTRAFLDTPVTLEQIHAILEAARFAPSGVNTQPWSVVVVTQHVIQKIGDAIIEARTAGISETPDYHYYPTEWVEPYKTRRKACGLALYSALNIGLNETEKRQEQWYKNYYFFGAPVGLLFFLDAKLKKGSWVDMGMFIQNVILGAITLGLSTCPQAALAEHPNIVRKIVDVPAEKALLCGMAIGFEDKLHPINQYRTAREPVESFTKFLGF